MNFFFQNIILWHQNNFDVNCFLQKNIRALYDGAGLPQPKFSFIIVTKRINTRIFGVDNGGGFGHGHGRGGGGRQVCNYLFLFF